MNLVTLSGYVRKKNGIKRTTRDEDSLTFILEVVDDGVKMKVPCVVFNRLVKRINKAVQVNDKVLIHGHLKTFGGNRLETIVIVSQLELLDFIRVEDKLRDDRKKTKQDVIQDRLRRIGR